MKNYIYISILLTLILFPQDSYSAEKYNLDYVLGFALKESLGIAEVDSAYAERIAKSREVMLPENPEIQFMQDKKNGTDKKGYAYEFVQPLKISDITGVRYLYASTIKNSASLEKQYEILKLINQTTSAYVNLWLLQETRRLYENSAKESDEIGKLVEQSAEGGQTSSSSAALFNADSYKLRSDVLAIKAELNKYETQLSLMTGINFEGVELEKPDFAKIPDDTDKLVMLTENRANLRNLIDAKVKEARKRLYTARLDALPQIGPRVTYSESVSGAEEYGIGVQIKIPLWSWNDAERLRANAELKSVKQQKSIFNKIPQKQVISNLQESATLLEKRNNDYETKISPSYRQSYELSKKMFQNGQISAIELWQIREKLYQTDKESIQSFLDYLSARNDLELEIGGKLEEIK